MGHAMGALMEGWRQELRETNSNIRVAGISPGLVETEFALSMYPDDPARAEATFKSFPCLQSEDIVDSLLYLLAAPSHVQEESEIQLWLKMKKMLAKVPKFVVHNLLEMAMASGEGDRDDRGLDVGHFS